MSFDLFGHGPRRLPNDDFIGWSDGPDRKRGPSKCRGVEGSCYDGTAPNPHDHSCCCDPCRHAFVDVCGQHCCRCIPKYICAVFTPNTIAGRCKQRVWRMPAVTSENDRTRSVYSFNTSGGVIELSVGFEPEASYEDRDCSWRLDSDAFGIHEIEYIDHSGPIHCQAPPAFVIEDIDIPYTVSGSPVSCVGDIRFEAYIESKVPFRNRWSGVTGASVPVACAMCDEVCSIVCVKRGNINQTTYTRKEFEFSGDRWGSIDNSGEYIELVEIDDECFLQLTEVGIPTLNGDLIAINPYECAIGMDLTAVDEEGNYIRISCNPCSCWEYICGTCRCLCPSLCMTGISDSEAIEPTILTWDRHQLRWGDDYFSVTPGEDDYKNCVAAVTGFDDPVLMSNSCGSDLSFFVSESLEDQLENGVTNFLAFRCSDCIGECGAGTCLDECEDVPSVLLAELSAAPWDEMLGCNPAELCFETIIIPLVQIFVATALNPAGEWRWIGSGVISCKTCLSATRTNHAVQIDLGCDGTGTLSVTDGTLTCQFELAFTLPCDGEAWDLSFDPFVDCDVLPGCCDVGGFILGVTE